MPDSRKRIGVALGQRSRKNNYFRQRRVLSPRFIARPISISLCFQASGVTVSDICKTIYDEIKKDKKHRYVVFYIRDEKQIDVEVVGSRNAQYEEFLDDLQKGGPEECRWEIFACFYYRKNNNMYQL